MLLLLIATAAQAAALPPTVAPVAAPMTLAAPAAAEKKVCRLEESASTRIRQKKICMTQSEWDAIAKDTQSDLEGSRNDRTIAPN